MVALNSLNEISSSRRCEISISKSFNCSQLHAFLYFSFRKLETILNKDAQPDNSLKYFTGEWFYEAKSRRHMDKIHGSEMILASMKQKKGALGVMPNNSCLLYNNSFSCIKVLLAVLVVTDGSLRLESSKSPSSQGSDTVPPPKPARAWDALQPQDIKYSISV